MSTHILRTSHENDLPFRAQKRRRLSTTSPLHPLSTNNHTRHPTNNNNHPPQRPKRSRSGSFRSPESPSQLALRTRKRRRPFANNVPHSPHELPHSAKRMRVAFEDVEMQDVMHSNERAERGANRRKKTLLRDVLRAEKVSRARWQSVVIQSAREQTKSTTSTHATHVSARAAGRADPVDANAQSATSEMAQSSDSFQSTSRLTGEEEVCEVIDASENSDPNANFGAGYTSSARGRVEPSVQAVLLEDGLCAVRIVRPDGSMQSVIIQPPDLNEHAW